MKKLVLLVCVAVQLASCSSAPKFGPHGKADLGDTTGDTQTIVIMGINDFHGALVPRDLKTREEPGKEPISYQAGGAPILAAHVNLLRSVFKSNFLLLDAGDEFQGTLESNLAEGAPVTQFYNLIGVNAAAIGNHEFDFGPAGPDRGGETDLQGALKARLQEATYPYVAANIYVKKTGKPIQFPNTFPSVMLRAGKLKIGVIGLSTTSTPVTTRPDFVKSLAFTNLKEATLREAQKLRAQGAQIVVITAHAGLVCDRNKFAPGVILTTHRENGPTDCEMGDEIPTLLLSLPQGTVDAVVSGHSHQVVHHWIAGVPVIQGGASGQYYNLIYLTYDWKQKKLLTQQTEIEGPVPVCPKVFENQNDCNGNRPAPKNGRGSLVTPKFHGASIHPDPQTVAFLKPVEDKTLQEKKRVVGQAARPIEHVRSREADMGNLITDAIRQSSRADFAMVNPGGIRASFDSGPITYESVFRTFPFDNLVQVLSVTGAELKTILRVAQSGSRGVFPVSGLSLKVIELESSAPATDLNGNRTTEHWEVNRLVEARTSSGAPIQDQKTYTLALPDFLVNGGDDMGWVMSKIPPSRRRDGGGLMRDALVQYLSDLHSMEAPINSVEKPLVDSDHPRIVFVKEPVKTKGKARKQRHRPRKRA